MDVKSHSCAFPTCDLSEFRTIVREQCDDKDKYFLIDRIPETLEELGFEPDSPTPLADGYRAWMPWWRGGLGWARVAPAWGVPWERYQGNRMQTR